MYRRTGLMCCGLLAFYFLATSLASAKRFNGRVAAFVVDKAGKNLGLKKVYTVTLDVDTAAKKGEKTSFFYEIHNFWGEGESESTDIEGVVKNNTDGLLHISFGGGQYLEDTQRGIERLRGGRSEEEVLKANGNLYCTSCKNGDLTMFKTKYVQSASSGVTSEKRTVVKGTLHPTLFLQPSPTSKSKNGKSKRHSSDKK